MLSYSHTEHSSLIWRSVRVVYRASLLRKWGVKPPEVRILSSPPVENTTLGGYFLGRRRSKVPKHFTRGFEKVARYFLEVKRTKITKTYTAPVRRETPLVSIKIKMRKLK